MWQESCRFVGGSCFQGFQFAPASRGVTVIDMGSITSFARKQSGITPVMVVLVAFILMDLGVVFLVALKEAQAKSKAEGLDVFDYISLLIIFFACIGKTVASFMNKSFTRWSDQREEQHAEERRIETELRLQGGPLPGRTDPAKKDPEGHLR